MCKSTDSHRGRPSGQDSHMLFQAYRAKCSACPKAEVALSGELYCVQLLVSRLRPKTEKGEGGW